MLPQKSPVHPKLNSRHCLIHADCHGGVTWCHYLRYQLTQLYALHLSIDVLEPFCNCGFGFFWVLLYQYRANKFIDCVCTVQQIQLLQRQRERERAFIDSIM